jgi:translation initiation factor 1
MSKNRGIRLEWTGGISQTPTKPDPKKLQEPTSEAVFSEAAANLLCGAAKIRREVKGRGGKPVCVLYEIEFSKDALAKNTKKFLLLKYSSFLKQKLACGGTIEAENLVLQCDDLLKVKEFLEKKAWKVKGGL